MTNNSPTTIKVTKPSITGENINIGASTLDPNPQNRENANQAPVEVIELKLSAITLDNKLQARLKVDRATVEGYFNNIKEGVVLDPITVFQEAEGMPYFLADGFHRYEAHKILDRKKVNKYSEIKILTKVHKGGYRDALLYSLSANAKRGLPLNNADKRKCVMVLLTDPTWKEEFGNREIARHIGVSEFLVRTMREEIEPKKKNTAIKSQADAKSRRLKTKLNIDAVDEESDVEERSAISMEMIKSELPINKNVDPLSVSMDLVRQIKALNEYLLTLEGTQDIAGSCLVFESLSILNQTIESILPNDVATQAQTAPVGLESSNAGAEC